MRNYPVVMLSGGPDALAELLLRVSARPNDSTQALHIAPVPTTDATYRQIEVLAWLGYPVPFHVLHVLPIEGMDPALYATPAVIAYARSHGWNEFADGMCTDDNTDHWQRLDAAFMAINAVHGNRAITLFTPPIIPTKQEVRDYLGPLWDLTVSCFHGSNCGRCEKCHQRNRTQQSCKPCESNSPEAWRSAITQWQNSAIFKTARDSLLTGHGWET